jgi:hypothetical protein
MTGMEFDLTHPEWALLILAVALSLAWGFLAAL